MPTTTTERLTTPKFLEASARVEAQREARRRERTEAQEAEALRRFIEEFGA